MSHNISIETTIERIGILADYIENVRKTKFNFGKWATADFKEDVDCGTCGCAIGHAYCMPYFRDLGLRLYNYLKQEVYPSVVTNSGKELKMESNGIGILTTIFGGNQTLMDELFIPCKGPHHLGVDCSPKKWAKQARAIIKRLREEHNIPEPKQQPQSSPQEQKSNQAGWRGLLETPRNLTSDRLGGCHAKYTPNGRSSCSEAQS